VGFTCLPRQELSKEVKIVKNKGAICFDIATILDNMSGVRNQRLGVFYPTIAQVWYSRRSHGILLMPRTSYPFGAFMLLMRKTSAHSSAIECVVPTETELCLFSAVVHCLVLSPFRMTRALSRCCQSLVLDHSYVVAYAESYTVQVARSVRVRCFIQTDSWIYAASTSRIRRVIAKASYEYSNMSALHSTKWLVSPQATKNSPGFSIPSQSSLTCSDNTAYIS